MTFRRWIRAIASVATWLAFPLSFGAPALAVPSFAVQTGQPCGACHVGGLGPQLTPFGRTFKINGYTARAVGFNVPLAIFAISSYVRTRKDQPEAPAPSFRTNDNVALDQVSLFLAGGFGHHLGAFVQTTYDGVSKSFSWDNIDLRAVTTANIKGANVVLGLSLNNNPTVQDGYNTLFAWGFPYTSSALAPSPSAGPLIGSLAQEAIGLTGYAWIDSQIYLEAGAYRSPSAGFLTHAGSDPLAPGKIKDFAPYGRVAYQKTSGPRNIELGAFAMHADLFPARDESTGLSDHYTDVGFDGAYQYSTSRRDIFSLNARYTHERADLAASRALGAAASATESLNDLRVDASYYWRNKIGGTVQAFDTWGGRDPLLYAANRTLKPDSSGLTFQVDGTPFGDGQSPFGARFNLRVGIQYTTYFRFDGARRNYNGLGRDASDNNTLRVFTWVYY